MDRYPDFPGAALDRWLERVGTEGHRPRVLVELEFAEEEYDDAEPRAVLVVGESECPF